MDFVDAVDIETPHPIGDNDRGHNVHWIHYVEIHDSATAAFRIIPGKGSKGDYKYQYFWFVSYIRSSYAARRGLESDADRRPSYAPWVLRVGAQGTLKPERLGVPWVESSY